MLVCSISWSEPNPQQAPSKSKSGKLSTQKSTSQEKTSEKFVTTQQLIDAISHAIEATADKAKATQNPPPPDNSLYWFSFFLTIFTGLLVVVGAGQCYIIFKTLHETKKAGDAANISANEARRSVEMLEKQMVVSQRAFVYVKTFHAHSINIKNNIKRKIISSEWQDIMPWKVIIIPEWHNIGNTETKNMFTHSAVRLTD